MKKKIICIVIAIVTIILGLIINKIINKDQLEESDTSTVLNEEQEDYIIDIKGEVNRPGIYLIKPKSRIIEIINIAGGFTKNADTDSINLAKEVYDGMQIVVLKSTNTKDTNIKLYNTKKIFEDGIVVELKGEVNQVGVYIVNKSTRLFDLIIIAGGFTTLADTKDLNLALILEDGIVIHIPKLNCDNSVTVNKISINNATISELMTIDGIGSVKAQAIIDYREQYGKFSKIEDIINVKGISQNFFEKIKEYITI